MEALPAWFAPIVTVAIHTGMRRRELVALRWTDVDMDTGSVTIRREKGGDGRWVALNSTALGTIRAIKRDRQVLSPYVFATPEGKSLRNNSERVWKGALGKAGVVDFRFHDCRHTFASRLVGDGVSGYIVQHAAGWRTPSMMARYAHLDPTTVRSAVERLASMRAARAAEPNGHQRGAHGREDSGATAASA